MAEEGGGGHGDGGSPSAIGSTQRLPPPPPPQPPQPGSQAPPAPALAPDQLPQNTLVALPIVAIENILSFMSYDEISQLRLVRPPRDPRRPLRRAEVWGGPERERAFPGEGAAAGARAPSAPLPPQSLCRGLSAGLVRILPLLWGWGRLPAGTWPWGTPCPPPGSGAAAGEAAGAGLPTSSRPECGRRRGLATCLLYITFQPPAGVGGPALRSRRDDPSQVWFVCENNVLFPRLPPPSFLVAENKVGSVGPPKSR